MADQTRAVYGQYDVSHEREPILWNQQDLSIEYRGKTYTRIFYNHKDTEEVDKAALKRRIAGCLPAYFDLYSAGTADEKLLVGFFVRDYYSGHCNEVARVWRE